MAGIYVHIPFCKQKCSYCDFHFSTTFSRYRKQMIDALIEEIRQRKGYLENKKIGTIYFGGGTPSLLTSKELSLIVEEIYHDFSVEKEIEFTLEANPDDIDEKQLSAWKSIGVNRLSIGVQSFFQEDLDWMNRAHTAEEGFRAIQQASEHGFMLSLDLIYGLPNHTLKELAENTAHILSLNPQHISAYCLTVESGTGLAHKIKTKQLPKVGEDAQADEFEFLVNELQKNGYEQYEISNFAKNEAYSVHNSNYWKNIEYLGIGPSAHSFNKISRQWNVANNHLYMKGILGKKPDYKLEVLTEEDRFNELLLLGLRTKWGVHLPTLFAIRRSTEDFLRQLFEFKKENLILEKSNRIFLTPKGKLQADFVASSLFW